MYLRPNQKTSTIQARKVLGFTVGREWREAMGHGDPLVLGASVVFFLLGERGRVGVCID